MIPPAVEMSIADLPEAAWQPEYGAFQIWPTARPLLARHSILYPVNIKRVAEEIFDIYGLVALGNDGKRWFYFGRPE